LTTISDLDESPDAHWHADATRRMNRMYRWQRHIYDATRRYYLLGRDQLIDDLKPRAGETVLEVGCGTGRNLIRAARQYPDARFYGIDVSTEMLTSAIASIERRGLGNAVRVAHGDATLFDPKPSFGMASFDHIMISYSLSMIPGWHEVLDNALLRLKAGGRLHVVDFGNQERLPGIMRNLLLRWLTLFDVTPRSDLQNVMVELALGADAKLTFARPFRGYAQSAVLALPVTRRI
jgi:S-adenosylmethionine-diacylgycerolhomoserine-N-methlytransferase